MSFVLLVKIINPLQLDNFIFCSDPMKSLASNLTEAKAELVEIICSD